MMKSMKNCTTTDNNKSILTIDPSTSSSKTIVAIRFTQDSYIGACPVD